MSKELDDTSINTKISSRRSSKAPISGTPPTQAAKKSQKTFQSRYLSWLPTLTQFRKDLKASIALLVALVMALDLHTRSVIGQTVLLVPIVVIFYFPVRTYGIQTEAVVYGTFGALISGLYSLLGTYLANLARDHTNKNLIQPGPSAVLAVFLFFGTFVLNYIRMKFHKANFAAVNACILLAFTMTEGAAVPTFYMELTWLFLRPIALAGAVALAVNYFLWPDDSVANYMQVLQSTLSNCETFFKENSEAFLNLHSAVGASSLPTLHSRLQGGMLLLIDCKRAVQREVLFSKLNGTDVGNLTRAMKNMYPSLHGLGLSVIMEKNYLSHTAQDPLLKRATDHIMGAAGIPGTEVTGFQESVTLMKSSSERLTQSAVNCFEACRASLSTFQPRSRSNLQTFLWPFPRIISFGRDRHSQHLVDMEEACQHLNETVDNLNNALEDFDQAQNSNGLQRYNEICQKRTQLNNGSSRNTNNYYDDKAGDEGSTTQLHLTTTHGPLYLTFLYQYSLRDCTSGILSLAHLIQTLHQRNTERHVHLPKMSLKKWFHASNEVDPSFFDKTGNRNTSDKQHAETNSDGGGTMDTANLSLVQTMTRSDLYPTEQDAQSGFIRTRQQRARLSTSEPSRQSSRLYMDPDVSPPSTMSEHLFDRLYKILLWVKDIHTTFALKTAVGMVMLAIPAWVTQSAGWFQDWRGQWSLITLCLWIFPMPGLFFFGIYTRVLGSIVGAVLGIVVWEITRGNPYGLAILCFALFIPLYHIFFFNTMYRVASLMAKITMILVIVYAYNGVLTGGDTIEPVWTIAGKRLLATVVGIVAAGILLLFPAPVQGRVELRKRLARTIRDIGRLYGVVTAEVATTRVGHDTTDRQRKAFRKLALDIRRQIADERNLLAHSKYEPPLRGKFPSKQYAQILETVDNLGALVNSMGYATRKIQPEWRQQVAVTLMKERREYLASIMTTLKLVSATLAAKTPLPPYLVEPSEARARFAKILDHRISIHGVNVENPSFASYSAYMMTGSAFVTELQQLLEAVTDLVGIEDPEAWITQHA